MHSTDLHSPALSFARRPPPERALIVAMMLVGVRDALAPPGPDRDAAERWLDSPSTAPFSWLWCCEMIDLDPQRARQTLAREPDALARLIRACHRAQLT